ncbi:MAG: hypothetical protein QOK09_3046, partial [Mycobacterium sp.]|nr:hypothetical protein [Mycobacterium sp.]
MASASAPAQPPRETADLESSSAMISLQRRNFIFVAVLLGM